MTRLAVSLLGADGPGVMHAATSALAALAVNVDQVSQTILGGEFAAILTGTAPEGLPAQDVRAALAASLAPLGVVVSVKPLAASAPAAPAREDEPGEPFVYTLRGPDRLGLIASITGVMAAHGVNIVGLAATTSETPEGKVDRVALVFQVALPQGADLPALRQALGGCASSMGMEGSLQHRDIFEAMHRISPL